MRKYFCLTLACLIVVAHAKYIGEQSNDEPLLIEKIHQVARSNGRQIVECPGCCALAVNEIGEQVCGCPKECKCYTPLNCRCPINCGCNLVDGAFECVGK